LELAILSSLSHSGIPKRKDLQGLDIDIGRRLAAEFNVRAEFVPIAWEDKFVELNNGNIDCIMSGFSQVNERENQIIFSKPYLKNNRVIIVKKLRIYPTKPTFRTKSLDLCPGRRVRNGLT
jgi:polar amino acid transport system substrate-binding protein